MEFCDKVQHVGVEGCDINLIDPAQVKKLKKTDLLVVVRKYHEIIEHIGGNNNEVVDKLQNAHEAFVSLAHCVYGADNQDKIAHLKKMCKKVVDMEAQLASKNQNETETFETINFEGVDYERCVGGEDNYKVFSDSMDWVGFWDEEKGKIVFRE